MEQIERYLIRETTSIHDAVQWIDRNGLGVVLVVDEHKRLIATVTDADVRAAILNNVSLNLPVSILIQSQKTLPYVAPITATEDMSDDEIMSLMLKYDVRQIPVIDGNRVPIRIKLMDKLVGTSCRPIRAMVSAGGFGTRLKPLTQFVPKPMVQINNKPILEHSLNHLKKFGITDFYISVYHKKDQIIDYFGDGSEFGISISYIHEAEPLGTGGALQLLPRSNASTLVINGDILTDLNINLFKAFHDQNGADLTVGVRQFEVHVPFGVVDLNGIEISQLKEKPKYYYFINAGVYLLRPSISRFLPETRHFNMTDVVDRVIDFSGKVISFPICGFWNDVGSLQDFERVKADMEQGQICF